jgi:hypothetical protein
MVSSGLLRRVALVRTNVSEEPGASFIRVTKIGVRRLLVAACVVPRLKKKTELFFINILLFSSML